MRILDIFKKNNIKYLFLGLLLFTDFIKNTTLRDFNTFSWYYLSIINSLTVLFILIEYKYFKSRIEAVLNNKISIIYIGFVVWSIMSFFYADNNTEVIIKSGVWINALFIFLNVSILFYDQLNFKVIAVLISINLLLGVYSSFSNYWELIKYTPYTFSNNSLLVGIAGNRNVTALLFCLKIPFILYLIDVFKNKYLKIISYLLLIFSIYTLLLLGSRSSYIYFSLILIISISYTFFRYWNNKKTIIKNLHLFNGFIISYFLFIIFVGSNNTASVNQRITSINIEDTSTQTRLRYYQHGLNSLINNPFIGVGLGNWKIKSIDLDSENIMSYIVPYYLHNDFLEIGAELGFIGLILYLSIFVLVMLKLMKMIYLDIKSNKNSLPKYILFLSLIVYFIDSNLNFPHGRALSQTAFNIILAFSVLINSKNEKQ